MPSSSLVEVVVEVEVGVDVGVEVEVGVEVKVYMLLKLTLKKLDWQVHYFLRSGWVGGKTLLLKRAI